MDSDRGGIPGVGQTLTPTDRPVSLAAVAMARFPIEVGSTGGSAATRRHGPSTLRDLGVVETQLLKLWSFAHHLNVRPGRGITGTPQERFGHEGAGQNVGVP